jgi:hypothetical protein
MASDGTCYRCALGYTLVNGQCYYSNLNIASGSISGNTGSSSGSSSHRHLAQAVHHLAQMVRFLQVVHPLLQALHLLLALQAFFQFFF